MRSPLPAAISDSFRSLNANAPRGGGGSLHGGGGSLRTGVGGGGGGGSLRGGTFWNTVVPEGGPGVAFDGEHFGGEEGRSASVSEGGRSPGGTGGGESLPPTAGDSTLSLPPMLPESSERLFLSPENPETRTHLHGFIDLIKVPK